MLVADLVPGDVGHKIGVYKWKRRILRVSFMRVGWVLLSFRLLLNVNSIYNNDYKNNKLFLDMITNVINSGKLIQPVKFIINATRVIDQQHN